MKICCLVIIILINNTSSNAHFDSTYYRRINNAIVLYQEGSKKEALKLYVNVFKTFKSYNQDYDDAIKIALEIGKRNVALKIAKKAVKSNGFQFYNSIRGKDKFLYNDSLFVEKIRKCYPKWRQDHSLCQDENILKISYLIRGLAESEQTVRVYIHSSDTTTWKYTNIVDSNNFFEFKEAIETFGYPDISKLDQKIVEDLELLLIHFRTLSVVTLINNSEMVWLDSLMKAQILIGNLHPTVFAFSYDRYYCLKSKKDRNRELQFYGLFNGFEGYTEIDVIESVDERRSSIFLLPLSIDAKISNKTLPNNYIRN